ncbi:ALF repeat-containing protein [Actinoplanes sp. NPDC026670]|uniref:ALF repeat-containing protein n=1 Tax=Actinoplanes sp. NPDC026670 TaxID=3154700 RepID=UPI0034027AB6
MDEVRAFVTTGLGTAALEDDRDRVLDITATTTKDAQRVAGQAVLDKSHAEIEEWLRTRAYPGKSNDDRIAIARLISTGGSATKAAATAALNGTDAARQAFLTSGRYEAEDTDNRVQLAQIISAGGPEVQAAGQIAVSGPRVGVIEFLKRGQYSAARRDVETATHVVRVTGLVQQAAKIAADARTDAANAQKAAAEARKAQEEAARYAQEANTAASQAITYAAQATQSAKDAAASAAKAVQSAQTARNAAASASAAAASAAQSAARAERSAQAAKAAAANAYTSMQSAYASAKAAGKSVAEAQAEADAALNHAIDLRRREEAEEPGDLTQPPADGSLPFRWTNLQNNLLAQANIQASGAECITGTKQFICFGVKTFGGKTMTIGDYLLYPHDRKTFDEELKAEAKQRADLRQDGIRSDIYGLNLLEHESNHSDQWALFPDTKSYLIQYWAACGYSYWKTRDRDEPDYGDYNWLEIWANPYQGNYWEVPAIGSPPPFNVREPVDILVVQDRLLDQLWRELTKKKCYMALWC